MSQSIPTPSIRCQDDSGSGGGDDQTSEDDSHQRDVSQPLLSPISRSPHNWVPPRRTRSRKILAFIRSRSWVEWMLIVGLILFVGVWIIYAFAFGSGSGDDCHCPKPPPVIPPSPSPTSALPNPSPSPTEPIRLPITVIPHQYTLNIRADLESLTFQGTVKINLNITSSTRSIRLHAVDLHISHATLINTSTYRQESLRTDTDTTTSTLTFIFDDIVHPGLYDLHMNYNGEMQNRRAKGFYRSEYHRDDEGVQYMAATHFEPIGARMAFPCFDEPSFKANFSIAVSVRDRYKVLSNSAVVRVVGEEGGWVRYEFGMTPRLSTYLVAWAVGEIESVSEVTKTGVTVSVYAQPGRVGKAAYALRVAVGAMDFFEERFGGGYPFGKLDCFPIPDFPAEAMENWGLMIFKDAELMSNDTTATGEEREVTAALVAHEIAHQWFGDLVTLAWWDDLWLNEGFAEHMQWSAVRTIEPTWDTQSLFFRLEHLLAFSADASNFTHPIATSIADPHIGALFDDISYNKGASVIGMLEHWLDARASLEGAGCGRFCEGLRRYLGRHSYGTATTGDLWEDLDFVDGGTGAVQEMMGTWVDQDGFPVISFSDAEDGKGVIVTQERFTLWEDGQNVNNQTWIIPFTYVVIANASISSRLDVSPPTTITLNTRYHKIGFELDKNAAILVNPGRVALFRTNYPPAIWHIYSHYLATYPSSISPVDRQGLISDGISLMLSNRLRPTDALPVLKFLANERDAGVWSVAVQLIEEVDEVMSLHPSFDIWRTWVIYLIRDVVNEVGWTGHDRHQRIRPIILDLAIKLGDEPTVQQGLNYFDALLNKTNNGTEPVDLPPLTLVPQIYETAIRHGPPSTYPLLLSHYLSPTENSTTLPGDVLSPLTKSPHPHQTLQTLSLLQNTTLIPRQRIPSLLHSLATATPLSHILVWDYIRDHVEMDRMGNAMMGVVEGVVKRVVAGEGLEGVRGVEGVVAKRGVERGRAVRLFREVRGGEVGEWCEGEDKGWV